MYGFGISQIGAHTVRNVFSEPHNSKEITTNLLYKQDKIIHKLFYKSVNSRMFLLVTKTHWNKATYRRRVWAGLSTCWQNGLRIREFRILVSFLQRELPIQHICSGNSKTISTINRRAATERSVTCINSPCVNSVCPSHTWECKLVICWPSAGCTCISKQPWVENNENTKNISKFHCSNPSVTERVKIRVNVKVDLMQLKVKHYQTLCAVSTFTAITGQNESTVFDWWKYRLVLLRVVNMTVIKPVRNIHVCTFGSTVKADSWLALTTIA